MLRKIGNRRMISFETGESNRRENVPMAVAPFAVTAVEAAKNTRVQNTLFKRNRLGLLFTLLHGLDHRADNALEVVFATDAVILHVDKFHGVELDHAGPGIAGIPFGER